MNTPSGLPIIVFDNEHYWFNLSNYSEVYFTDLSSESFLKAIYLIDYRI